MNSITHTHTRLAAAAAMAASVALGVGGVTQLTDTPSGETTVVGIEHVTLGALTATTLLLVPVVLLLGRLVGRVRPAAIASAGLVALGLLTTVSNVRGEDPSFFAAVAVPSNLAIFGGLVALAVALRRRGLMPPALAIALPLTWLFALPLSNVGGGLVAGGYWLLVGWMLHHGELPHARLAASEPARA